MTHFLDIIHRPNFNLKYDVSETEIYLHPHVKFTVWDFRFSRRYENDSFLGYSKV
jgi:hypothetical protein